MTRAAKLNKILSMPDSELKLLKLENWLLALQHHGAAWVEAKKEWERLYNLIRSKK